MKKQQKLILFHTYIPQEVIKTLGLIHSQIEVKEKTFKFVWGESILSLNV